MVPALFEFISGRSLWWRHFHFGRSQDTSMIARSHFFYPSVCIGFRVSLTGCGWDKSFCPCLWRTLRLQSPVNDRRHTQLTQYWHVNGKQGEQWGSRFVSRVLSHLASWVRGSTRADLAQHSTAQLKPHCPSCLYQETFTKMPVWYYYYYYYVLAPNKTVDQHFLYPVNNSRQCSGEHILSVEGTTVFVYWYLV